MKGSPLSTQVRTIVKFCAEEVERQGNYPEAVHHMVNAWDYAMRQYPWPPASKDARDILNPHVVECIGVLVSPVINSLGFRTGRIQIGVTEGAPAERIRPLLAELFEPGTLKHLSPEEVLKEYLIIHPFYAGNGRTGKIIYNFLRGTLDQPICPVDPFKRDDGQAVERT